MLGPVARQTGRGGDRDDGNMAGKGAWIRRSRRPGGQSREDRRVDLVAALHRFWRHEPATNAAVAAMRQCRVLGGVWRLSKDLPLWHLLAPLRHFWRHEPAGHVIGAALRQQPKRPGRTVLCGPGPPVIQKRERPASGPDRSEEHTSELQSRQYLV